MLAAGVRWFDDWFAIREIAAGITAIGEPRFHQTNWNYLVAGTHTALMFDTGPGVRDITPVIRTLTKLPVIAMPSHLHFDHTGNLHLFDDIALPDLAVLRDCMRGDVLHASDDLFRGFQEGMVWKPCNIKRWWPIGSSIELGGRDLQLLYTPGHSPDSVSLFDVATNTLLAADFIYPGPLYAQVPGADLQAYLASAQSLLPLLGEATAIYGAHGMADAQGNHDVPQLGRTDVADLLVALETLKQSGKQLSRWPVNDRMHLLLGAKAFAAWQK